MMNGIDQLEKKVKNGAVVIALSGDEPALLDDALDLVRKAYLTEGAADLNHHKFFALDDASPNVMPALLTMPFLATHRLVEVHNAEKLDAALVTALIEYLSAPCPSSILLLIFHKTDKRNKLLSSLEAGGAHIVLSVKAASDRRKFLADLAKAHGISIAANGADFLLTITEGDLLALKNAVEKLALIGQEITLQHIEQHVVTDNEQDVFALARSIAESRLADSLTSLGRLRNNHENAIKFLGVLQWQMRVLVHIRSCLDHGMSDGDIRTTVNVFGDRFTWMMLVARKRNLEFHIDRLTKLIECDKALKTGAALEPFHVIEKYVYQQTLPLVQRR